MLLWLFVENLQTDYHYTSAEHLIPVHEHVQAWSMSLNKTSWVPWGRYSYLTIASKCTFTFYKQPKYAPENLDF